MKLAIIGGHMAPALGFLSALPKDIEVVYIGRKHVFEGDKGVSLEYQTITQKGIRFIPLETGRIQRSLSRYSFSSLAKIPKGFAAALVILKQQQPDVVVAFGSYVSVPLGIAARLLQIPLVIHESTLERGLANRILSPFAEKICISWDSSREYFPKNKTVLTGNPLLPISSKKNSFLTKSALPLISIVGGSGGSHAINMLVSEILPKLVEKATVVHQTGDAQEFNDYTRLLAQKKLLPQKLEERYSVIKFIPPDEITNVFSNSSLVVGRSGINTVTVLLALHKKALLIPLPSSQNNEQLKNAQLLESEGLGKILMQKDLTSEKLLEEMILLLDKKIKSTKWHIPVEQHGARNMVEEVLACVSQHHEK